MSFATQPIAGAMPQMIAPPQSIAGQGLTTDQLAPDQQGLGLPVPGTYGQVPQYMPPADGGMPGLGGKGSSYAPTTAAGLLLGPSGDIAFNQMIQAVPEFAQAANSNQTQANANAQIPTGVQQGGTPGRPVPVEQFTPRGPGFANPGGKGAAPQVQVPPPNFTPSILTTPQGQNLPFRGQQPARNLSPQPVGRPPVMGTMAKPSRGIGTIAQRGAGRGGILR